MLNQSALRIFETAAASAPQHHCLVTSVAGASVLDAGITTRGSLAAGLLLARLCLADRGSVELEAADGEAVASTLGVAVRTDDPVPACLAAQYAGWPLQTEGYFGMASGPMRAARGREALLESLQLTERPQQVVGVIESDQLPTEAVIEFIAEQCGVEPDGVHLAVAPTSSIAGSLQVVARSIETALHKLHELQFDVGAIVSAAGHAPLPPPARPGDTVEGIGRTNDAILYGGVVTLWIDHDDAAIESVIERVPSCASADYGKPFAKIFADYDHDFYRVDPLLFSPAEVTIHSLRSGRTFSAGRRNVNVLRQSFGR